MITTILFDLDGTLLPMDQDLFLKAYIGGLVKTASTLGYDPETMKNAIMSGTFAMINNDGTRTNEDAFGDVLKGVFGETIMDDYHMFDEFYRTDFQKIKDVCGFDRRAKEIIECVKNRRLKAALATNPMFPVIATESRIRWAGLDPKDFELYTTYETSRYCKPNLDYYREVLSQLGVLPEECLMVGNDAHEDMISEQLGMKVFLLTDCLINKNNADISRYPQGSFDELFAFIDRLER